MTILTQKQSKAIAALLESPTMADAADTAGCARSTLYKWLQEDDFLSALRVAQVQALTAVNARYAALLQKSLDALAEELGSENPRVRLRAAAIILQNACRIREGIELEERISKLEGK